MGLRRPIYVLLGIFVLIGSVSAAYAIGIQLAGDVTIDGTLTTGGVITSPTITDLQTQITALTPGGTPPPTNLPVDFLDGIDSTGFALSQSCPTGQVVKGIDSTGNLVCANPRVTVDFSQLLDNVGAKGGISLTIGNDGFPVGLYVDFSDNLRVFHCNNTLCSDIDTVATLTLPQTVRDDRISIAIGTDGFPIIAYHELTTNDIEIVHCTDVSCSNNDAPETIASSQVLGLPDMKIGSDGFPVIVYGDDFGTPDVIVAHCSDATCASSPTINTIETNANDGNTITIGSDGLPIVAFGDTSTNFLKVVHCSNVSCSDTGSNTITTVDSSGSVATAFVSVAVGTDGFPIISYQDASLGNLQVIHCTNVTCSSFDSPVIIDDGGLDNSNVSQFVGENSRIVIGNDGLPLIAYGDSADQSFLRLVNCTSVDCSTFNSPEYIARNADSSRSLGLAIGTDGLPVIVYRDSFEDEVMLVKVGGIGL